ncbi:MAG: methyltransferase domain-containing protein [Candidatus Aenigmarchaeota archaeon]|nr:methyltransferase domain-containing protein [Candidatus Aenigmarchaeota archaeon]
MEKIQPYTRRDFFKEIPDLESKTLLDVGASEHCIFSMAYLMFLYDKRARTKEKLDEKAYNESKKFRKNIVTVDLEYKGKLSSILPETSICADARKLPFDNESFDIVAIGWLLDCFENNSEVVRTINESVRVLKSNGYLIGDAPLHPPITSNEKLKTPKLLSNPKYSKQIEKYRRVMTNEGIEFLKEGIGFNTNEIGNHLTFYFIGQKR